jgi:hypothetical protein
MDLQHINVKLIAEKDGHIDLEPVIPVFHSWIQDRVCEELLLDVADYRHVHAGPGVVLIGHESNYSVDNGGGRLGVLYNRKAVVEGTRQDRLVQATRAAILACQRLEGDARLKQRIRFNGRELDLFINDRLLAPNVDATREVLEPELRKFLQRLFGGAEYSLQYDRDPRHLFSLTVKAAQGAAPTVLLKNLLS